MGHRKFKPKDESKAESKPSPKPSDGSFHTETLEELRNENFKLKRELSSLREELNKCLPTATPTLSIKLNSKGEKNANFKRQLDEYRSCSKKTIIEQKRAKEISGQLNQSAASTLCLKENQKRTSSQKATGIVDLQNVLGRGHISKSKPTSNEPTIEGLVNQNKENRTPVTTIIIGDSTMKGLRHGKITKSVNHKSQVKCFPGSTVNDMVDYIKPFLKLKPDSIILHVGTKDLRRTGAKDIAKKINSLCNMVKSNSSQRR